MSYSTTVVKNSLTRRLRLILSTKTAPDFYLEICNYLFFVNTDSRLRHIKEEIRQIQTKDLEEYEKLKNNALKDISNISQNLKERLTTNQVTVNEIDTLFSAYTAFANGQRRADNPLWSTLVFELRAVCFNAIARYATVNFQDIAVNQGNKILFVKEGTEQLLKKTNEELNQIKKIQKTAIWAAWDRLVLVAQAIYASNTMWQEEMKKNPLDGLGLALLMNEMEHILNGQPVTPPTHFEKDATLIDLQRLHNFILDKLDRTSLGLSVLKTYKQRCEWYGRERILKLADGSEDELKINEAVLTRELCVYLHGKGIIPLSEVVFGGSRPDVLGVCSEQEFFPLEIKLIKAGEAPRLKAGFNQILTYARTIGVSEAFYVIFCCGDFTLQVPNTIIVGNERINLVTIDIFQTSPSERKARVWTVTEEELLQPLPTPVPAPAQTAV